MTNDNEFDVYLGLSQKEILSEGTIYDIVELKEPFLREIAIAQCLSRLDELGADKAVKSQFIKAIKMAEKADGKLESDLRASFAKEKEKIQLARNGKGAPMTTSDNFLRILREDERFSDVRYNLLTNAPERVLPDGSVTKWTDKDDAATRLYIEQKYHIHSREKMEDALRVFFAEREYHPIKEIIEAVEWDGVPRIGGLLTKWLKAEDTPYVHEVSRLIFAGGIHRLYRQGCKFDNVPVLIGTKQGEGKSTFVRMLALCDNFFTEVTEIEGQKGIEAIEGAWICEIAELLAVTKAREVEAVKAYITKQSDHYRRPFERRTTDMPRQCIFIGTTNREQFLTDKTGNRRWYPVRVHSDGHWLFDHMEEIKADILQCWAEAKALYDRGEIQPYAKRELLSDIKAAQAGATEEDYRVGLIAKYLDHRDEVCILEVWENALDNPFSRPSKRDSNEIALILRGLGYVPSGLQYFLNWGRQMAWKNETT